MAAHTYECLFLLDPNKASADPDGVAAQVNGIIERYGGEIIVSRPWGESKLAYPIAEFRKGIYHLTYFKADSTKVPSMEHDFRLCEPLLRHLLLKLHSRIAEEILAHLQGGEIVSEVAPLEERAAGGGRR